MTNKRKRKKKLTSRRRIKRLGTKGKIIRRPASLNILKQERNRTITAINRKWKEVVILEKNGDY